MNIQITTEFEKIKKTQTVPTSVNNRNERNKL